MNTRETIQDAIATVILFVAFYGLWVAACLLETA